MAIFALAGYNNFQHINVLKCRGGGTGRHKGLKIPWRYAPCGFDSRPRHQIQLKPFPATGKAFFMDFFMQLLNLQDILDSAIECKIKYLKRPGRQTSERNILE